MINQSDADRMFITVNSSRKGPLIPANALVRFQFLEIIIRLGIKRYFESGLVDTEVEAIKKLKEINIYPELLV